MSAKWKWVSEAVVLAIHESQLAEHGGGSGIRDIAALQSALARPLNRIAYGSGTDIADLAASYAFGLTRNHPFIDGNKRVALVVLELFLNLNGCELAIEDRECIATLEGLAAGKLTESALASWIRKNLSRY